MSRDLYTRRTSGECVEDLSMWGGGGGPRHSGSQRRSAISTEPISAEDLRDVLLPVEEEQFSRRTKSEEERANISQVLSRKSLRVLFGSLSPEQLSAVIDSFEEIELNAGAQADTFYIVIRGQLDILSTNSSFRSPPGSSLPVVSLSSSSTSVSSSSRNSYSLVAASSPSDGTASDPESIFSRRTTAESGHVHTVSSSSSLATCSEPSGLMRVNSASAGDCFGHMSLFYGRPAESTVKAGENSSLWALSRRVFQGTVISIQTRQREEMEECLKMLGRINTQNESSVPTLSLAATSCSDICQLVDVARMMTLIPYERFIRHGSLESGWLFIVMKGCLFVTSRRSFGGKSVATPGNSHREGTKVLSPSNEQVDDIEEVRKFASNDWYITIDSSKQVEEKKEQKQSFQSHIPSPELKSKLHAGGDVLMRHVVDTCEQTGYGVATLSECCEFMLIEIPTFERLLGPLEWYIK